MITHPSVAASRLTGKRDVEGIIMQQTGGVLRFKDII